MNKQISYKIVSLVFSILVICFAVGFYVLAVWTEPGTAPPGGNVDAPLNVSGTGQAKAGGLVIHSSSSFEDPANPNALLIPYGNVGIGTLNPSSGTGGQLKLDVEGPVGATQYCDQDGNNCTTAGGLGGGFGVWNDRNKDGIVDTVAFNTTYYAQTDGLAMGWVEYWAWPEMLARTGSEALVTANHPSTLIMREGPDDDGGARQSLMFPVRKGDYWKIGLSGTAPTKGIYWMPIGN